MWATSCRPPRALQGGIRRPLTIIRWAGKVKPGSVENGIFSGLDWLPTLTAAAGNSEITDQLLRGVQLGDRTYKNHLDGYDQMDLLLGKGPSARHELFYFGGPKLGAIRIDDFKYQFFQQPYAASSSGCAIRPRVQDIGSTGSAERIPSSPSTDRYAMATAEQWEPYKSRGSHTVLGEPGGESPPGHSSKTATH
jgi:hypothetical protein